MWCHRKAQSLLVDLVYVGLCTLLVILSSVLVFWTAFALPLTHFEALLAGIEQVLILVAVHDMARQCRYMYMYVIYILPL